MARYRADIATGPNPARPGVRPLELLLEHQKALELTPEQLERLDGIRARLAGENEPLVARMLTLRRQWQLGRRGERQEPSSQHLERQERIRAAAESIRARIQRNNQTAMRAVNRLLTVEQRSRLRGIVKQRRKQGAAPQAPGAGSYAGSRD